MGLTGSWKGGVTLCFMTGMRCGCQHAAAAAAAVAAASHRSHRIRLPSSPRCTAVDYKVLHLPRTLFFHLTRTIPCHAPMHTQTRAQECMCVFGGLCLCMQVPKNAARARFQRVCICSSFFAFGGGACVARTAARCYTFSLLLPTAFVSLFRGVLLMRPCRS